MSDSVRESRSDSVWLLLGYVYESVRRREITIREAVLSLVLTWILWSTVRQDSDGVIR